MLPFIVARGAAERGVAVVTVGLEGFADERLAAMSSAYATEYAGQLLRCIEFLRDNGADAALLCGQVDHRQVFDTARFDELMLSVLQDADKRAEPLLSRITTAIEANGLPVADIRPFVALHLVPDGTFGVVEPEKSNIRDLAFGWPLARKLAELNIGQAMMVKGGVVIAVEAIEGTDGMIRRVAPIGLSGCTVIKLPLGGKDPRFDMPVIGSGTIASMVEAGVSLLAVAAGQTIVIDPEECRDAADAAGIAIVARPLDWEPGA